MDPNVVQFLLESSRNSLKTLAVEVETSAYPCYLSFSDIQLLISHNIACTIAPMGGFALPDNQVRPRELHRFREDRGMLNRHSFPKTGGRHCGRRHVYRSRKSLLQA